MIKTALILFAFLLFPITSYSESRIAIVNDENTSINLVEFSEVYRTSDTSKTFNEVFSLAREGYFIPVNEPFLQLDSSDGNVWIKTELSFQKSTDQASYLYIKAPKINAIDLYFPQINQSQSLISTRGGHPLNLDQIHHPEHLIPIPNAGHNTVIIFIKMSSESADMVQFFAVDNTEIIKISIKNSLFIGTFIGIIVIFLVASLLFSFYTQHNMYILYSALLSSILIIHLSHHGIINYFVLNKDPIHGQMINLFFLFYLSSLAFFTRHYLDTSVYLPKIDKTLLLLGSLNLIFCFTFFLYPDQFNNTFSLINLLITNTILITLSIYALIKKTPHSGYFLVSRSIVLLGLYFWVLSAYGIYSSPFFYQWGLMTIMLLEACIYFSGMIKRLIHFSYSSPKTHNVTTSITEVQIVLSDTGERMKRQINILDNYIAYWRSTSLKDNEKNLNFEATLASNNLKLLMKNLALLTNNSSKHEEVILLDKLIQNALEQFNNIDQDNTDLSLESSNTKNVEVLKDALLFQQIIINLAQECKQLNGQPISIQITHVDHTKLGIKTLNITCDPLSSRSINDFSSFNLGLGLIKKIIEYLEGKITLLDNNTLFISIPIQTRVQLLSYDRLEADPAQILVIGNESVLVQRTLRSLQVWPNNVLQIKNISELFAEVQTLQLENTINLVLMFENEGYIPNLALKQIRERLHAGDQCILVTENDKMSRNYALTLGFDDLFSNTNIEQQLKDSLERFTLKGLRIKNASLQTASR